MQDSEPTHYRGRPIDEMTREELIEALKQTGSLLRDANEAHLRAVRIGKDAIEIARPYIDAAQQLHRSS